MKESNTNLIYKKKEEHSVIIPDSALMRRRVTLGKSGKFTKTKMSLKAN